MEQVLHKKIEDLKKRKSELGLKIGRYKACINEGLFAGRERYSANQELKEMQMEYWDIQEFLKQLTING